MPLTPFLQRSEDLRSKAYRTMHMEAFKRNDECLKHGVCEDFNMLIRNTASIRLGGSTQWGIIGHVLAGN